MGTKFASYTLKLASLHEYYQRLLIGSQPVPSGIEMANTLKYFFQALLSLLKDVEKSPYEMLKFQNLDMERLALYPNLDYKQLFNALSQLIDVIPSVNIGLSVLGQALLQCLACLLPFLDHDLIDSLPFLTASLISVLPEELHQDIINYLCYYVLPFTIGRKVEEETENYATQSISAVIMVIFEYSKDNTHHCQLLECLMALKSGIIKDILCVIAYGTSYAMTSAANLLFYYWPMPYCNLCDQRAIFPKFPNEPANFLCQRDECSNAVNSEAAKVCFNHSISIEYATDSPPPLYLCIECANEIHRANPNQMFFDILHPMQQISLICENKNCRAADKMTVSTCFSTECTNYNSNHPIRYCTQCHNIRHNNNRGNDHVFHTALDHITKMDSQVVAYIVQAITRLLKEAEPTGIRNDKALSEPLYTKTNTSYIIISNTATPSRNNIFSILEERQLLGRYGIWLLVDLCSPDQKISEEILGRMISILFHWFHITAYAFDGQTESSIEKLKAELACPWLFKVMKKNYKVFTSCLLPHPLDYVRVGGHWETLSTSTSHLKDGLNRLFCLVPYEVITPEVWDHIMPHWMEAIVNDVPVNELQEFKVILCKILDPDLSPLGFDTERTYNFVTKRFIGTNRSIQRQTLGWLQALTVLEITIPLPLLFSMFNNGVTDSDHTIHTETHNTNARYSLNKAINYSKEAQIFQIYESIPEKATYLSDDGITTPKYINVATNEELSISCCILMLDILLKQMELQNIKKYTGVNGWICRDICYLLKSTNIANLNRLHTCKIVTECTFCESKLIWYQLCVQLLRYVAPEKLAYPPDVSCGDFEWELKQKSPSGAVKKCDSKPDVVLNMPIPELHSVGGVLVHMPHVRK